MKTNKGILILTLLLFSLSAYCQQANFDVTAADGNGFRFWNGNDFYKIHMGNSSEYHYGPVTDYSIKMNMNDFPGRGWTWGIADMEPIAALNNQGNFQVAGNLVALKRLGIGIADPGAYIDIINSAASETFLRFRVADALSDYFMIANTTGESGQFIPLLKAKHVTDNRPALTIMGEINPENDSGNEPLVSFNARRYNSEVTTRPLFSWANYTRRLMILDAKGRLGIGTTNAIKSTLEVKGVITASSNTTTNYSSFFVSGDGNAYMNFAGGDAGSRIGFQIDGGSAMSIFNNKSVGINTSSAGNHKLAVGGSIGAHEVKVEVGGWSDFVFEEDYELPTLQEVESHIKEKGHLKDIPSAKEVVENGIYLGEMDSKLLQKIEELTLYIIAQEKEIKEQREEIEVLKKQNTRINQLEEKLSQLLNK